MVVPDDFWPFWRQIIYSAGEGTGGTVHTLWTFWDKIDCATSSAGRARFCQAADFALPAAAIDVDLQEFIPKLELTITLDDAGRRAALFGPGDRHLRLIR